MSKFITRKVVLADFLLLLQLGYLAKIRFRLAPFVVLPVISRSLERFFLAVGPNNFGNKIPFLLIKMKIDLSNEVA